MNKVLIPEFRFPDFVKEGEWEKKTLNSVSEVIMGSSPSSSSYNENKTGLPLLQGNADIKNRLSVPRIYTSEVTKECEVDDILLSVRAPVGTVAKSLHKACIGRGISALRATKPNSQEYLYQWFFSYESSWQNISQGGTFDAVNSDDIRNLLLPIPKPQEQKKIAFCLSSLDEVIAGYSQKLELLKDHKKGLMQNLFPQEGESLPKYRFPEFVNTGKWLESTLGDKEVSYFVTEKVSVNMLNLDSYVSTENMLSDFSGVSKAWKLPQLGSFTKFKNGDILISNIRPYLKKVWKADKIGGASNDVLVFRSGLKVISEFLECIIKNEAFINYVMESAKGVKMPRGDKSSMQKYIVFIPSKDEQQKIASCLSACDELITAQMAKIEQLKLHKKGLMQGLFPKIND